MPTHSPAGGRFLQLLSVQTPATLLEKDEDVCQGTMENDKQRLQLREAW